MSYNIFKKDADFSNEEINQGLIDVVSSSLKKVFLNCDGACNRYEFMNDKENCYPGIKGMLPIVNNDILIKEVFSDIKHFANLHSVERQNSVFNMELIHGKPLVDGDELIVAKNVDKYKDNISELCLLLKDDLLLRYDNYRISERMKADDNQVPIDSLTNRINSCIEDHDFKILTINEKIDANIKKLNKNYPEKSVKEYVFNLYEKDLKGQLDNINNITRMGVNEYKDGYHNNVRDIINYKLDDVYNEEKEYGVGLSENGKKILDMKKEILLQNIANIDDSFEIFYISIRKNLLPIIENDSKLSMMDKLKRATFSGNIDIESDIKSNEGNHNQIESKKNIKHKINY